MSWLILLSPYLQVASFMIGSALALLLGVLLVLVVRR